MRNIFFLFTFLISFSVKLNAEINQIIPSSKVFEDPNGEFGIEDIINTNIHWQSNIKGITNEKSTYWIKINIDNFKEELHLIEVISPHTEYIEYYANPISKDNVIRTGHLLPYETREYKHKNFVFKLLPTDRNKAIYFKIKSSNKVGFLFKKQTTQFFAEYSVKEYLFLGIYYGLLALLIIYHLVLFLVIRKKVYLFYSLSVLFAGLISSSDDGLGVIYIWGNFLELSQPLGLIILPIGFLFAFTLYSTSFLGSDYPKRKRIILLSSAGYVILFLIQILISESKTFFSNLYFIPFLIIYLTFLYSYWKTRYKPFLYFLIGFSFSLFGLLINQLRLLEIIHGNLFTVYAFNVGVALEFLSLALSLGYRFKEEQKLKIAAKNSELKMLNEKNEAQNLMMEAINEKEKATREINEQLELKVNDRTKQLNDLIQKLKALNLDYDKENWDLKRNIRSEKESKLLQEKLTIQELRSLYPNNLKCLEFLAELKWGNTTDYSCPKCGYQNYSTNKSNLSRKCSKCSSSNSVTKGSIFQSQKMDLNKLFYITYLWSSSSKINVKELSKTLNISEVSIYNFIKKLKEKKEQKVKEKLQVSSWKDLIF